MKILNYFNWVIKIILFLLILVLVLDNMQVVQFSIYNIHTFQVSLIILILIFLGIGFLIGLLFNIIQKIKLKNEIKQLLKKNAELTKNQSINSSDITVKQVID